MQDDCIQMLRQHAMIADKILSDCREHPIDRSGYMRYDFRCFGLISSEILDKNGQTIAYAVGEFHISHIIVGGKNPVRTVSGTRLMSNCHALFSEQRGGNAVFPSDALAQSRFDESLFFIAYHTVREQTID